jgi:hypothetical protein
LKTRLVRANLCTRHAGAFKSNFRAARIKLVRKR